MTSKRYLVVALLLIGGVSLAAGLVFAMDKKDSPYKNYKGYDSLWKKVDTCEAKGLTQDALKEVMNIYQLAKKEHNAPQIVKSVIYRAKYTNEAEEFSVEKNIELLRKESESAEFPANAILQSVLAEQYWHYYEVNRWELYERSTVVDVKSDDVATYDAKTLVGKSIWYYQQSLKQAADLKIIPVNEFDHIITKGGEVTRQWRPYLYDLLAHRALEFFKNSEAEVTKAGNRFSLNEDAYLKPYPEFLKTKINTPEDSLELKYYSLKLYQELLNFHRTEKNNEALADLELRRFEFLNQYSQNPIKDSLYLQAMNWLIHHFEKSTHVAEFKYNMANWWVSQSEKYEALQGNQHKWDRKKAMEIYTEILSKHPKSRCEKTAGNAIIGLLQKSLQMVSENVLEPNTPNRLLCTYKNVTKMYFKIVRFTPFQYHNLLSNANNGKAFNVLAKLPAVKTFSVELPDDKDYNQHAVEVAIPGLDYGQYVLLSCDNENFSVRHKVEGTQNFTVSDLSYLSQPLNTGGKEFRVVHRQTGKKLAGVTAVRWKMSYDYASQRQAYTKTETFTSDKNGIFSIPKTNSYDQYYIQLIHNKDTLFSIKNNYD
ncbi:MAG: hypothetical protein IT236_10190, partial [Bacteroidia bacterium]|nr:hypothetical protein [Bacteroidia bacterium]